MIERLLIPSWNAPPRSLDDWRARFEALGLAPRIERDGPEETWIVLDPIGTRLLAVVEGPKLTALHAEVEAFDAGPALAMLDQAAGALSWEVHDEEVDDDEPGP